MTNVPLLFGTPCIWSRMEQDIEKVTKMGEIVMGKIAPQAKTVFSICTYRQQLNYKFKNN